MRAPELDFPATMPALLHRAVEQHGDADFVVSADGRCSFREAEHLTRVLAKRMLATGVGKGTPVGIAFPSSVDWMVGWIAAARIGALAMLFSSTYRPAELRNAMRIGDVSLLLAPHTMLGADYEARLEHAVPGLAERGPGPLYVPELPYLRGDLGRRRQRPPVGHPGRVRRGRRHRDQRRVARRGRVRSEPG